MANMNQARLEKLTGIISRTVTVEQVYLFGSYAYGTPNEDSDLDLYVVIPDGTIPPAEAVKRIRRALYPVQDMAAGSISLALGAGAHKAAFPAAVSAGDELALLASSRECLKNGLPTEKRGFFQYTAAGDSKHPVTLEEGKSARLLFVFQEMQEGGDAL